MGALTHPRDLPPEGAQVVEGPLERDVCGRGSAAVHSNLTRQDPVAGRPGEGLVEPMTGAIRSLT
jgi:hypothetical protein